MPSYFFHLKFELYSTSNPLADEPTTPDDEPTNIWLPLPHTTVFDDFPSHPRPKESSAAAADDRDLELSTALVSSQSINIHQYPSSTTQHLSSLPKPNLIDCGASRAQGPDKGPERRIEIVSERQWKERANSVPLPSSTAAIKPQTAVKDWRFGPIRIESVSLSPHKKMADGSGAAPTLGPTFGAVGTLTKAKLLPLETKNTELGWGVVHFYRDGDEHLESNEGKRHEEPLETGDGECSTICIPAVPGYMTPSDFLGYVGEKAVLEDISHCRLVMSSQLTSYLALLKFRDAKRARQWQKEYDGRVFSLLEPKICHAVFVKSITFETPMRKSSQTVATSSSGGSGTLRPFPPPTPNLVELPTCPICLERMDETSGLMTVPCSHVFHCRCLQRWKGAGCSVCRFTNPMQGTPADPSKKLTQPLGSSTSDFCTVCDCTDDLWLCLICGYVGCGRYKSGHAKEHWKETAHCFALEVETQHVWDYLGDKWVHRFIHEQLDVPEENEPGRFGDQDAVPRAKMESIGLEYTLLITSQLDSQRMYYEEMLNKAVDKAAKASASAEDAAAQASAATERLAVLEEKYRTLGEETVPQLGRDLERERLKAAKGVKLARSLGDALQEEKRLNDGLLQRIEHVNKDHENMTRKVEELRLENAELKEMNRDLTMFISGQEKLKELENEGKIEEGELEGSSARVPEKKGRRRRK